MINNIAILIIEYYQKYISPHKGYCCAYSYYTGEPSCSEITKNCIKKYGIVKTLPLFRKQIEKCRIVYFAEQEKIKSKKEVDKCNEMAGICACL